MKSKQMQLDITALNGQIQVYIPEPVQNKIRYLCSIISNVEWSGILLYTTEGSIQDPENMKITLKDIILMDKGSKAYTEYNFTEKKRDQSGYEDRHIDYCEEFEEALNWNIGQIHSHNHMKVFFSNTDVEELIDTSPSHNFYLSVIVNNADDIIARVSFETVSKHSFEAPVTALNNDGEEYQIDVKKVKYHSKHTYYYNCNIIREPSDYKEDFFTKNVREVLNYSEKPFTIKSATTSSGYKFPSLPVNQSIMFPEDLYEEDEEEIEDFVLEVFKKSLLPLTSFSDNITFLEVLETMDKKSLYKSNIDIVKTFSHNFYTEFVARYEEENETLVEVLEDSIEFLEIHEENFNFLGRYIEELQQFLQLV